MQKRSQDKRTPNLADAREKPQDGKKPFDQFFLLLYQMFSRKREYKKSKLTCEIKPKTNLSNQQQLQSNSALTRKSNMVNTAIKHPQSSSVIPNQTRAE